MRNFFKKGLPLMIVLLGFNIFLLPKLKAQAASNDFTYSGPNGWWSEQGYDANKITNRVVSGDFNGDGKTDTAGLYDYGNGETRIHVWLSNASNFNYTNANGWWGSTGYSTGRINGVTAGDFNGDGKSDIAVFYDYGNGETRIHVFLSYGTKFNYQGANGWWNATGYDSNKIKGRVVSGDFNGDGKSDLASFYDYGHGETKIHVFLSDGNKFVYQDANGWWNTTGYDANKITERVVSGDFNKDGKTDIAAFYDYGGAETKLHVWLSTGNNFNYTSANGWWNSTGYDANRITGRVVSGDFDAQGGDDIAAIYDYGNGAARIHVFTSTGSSFNYTSADGWWKVDNGYDVNKITGRVVAGNFDNKGGKDIAAVYDYGYSESRIHTWISNAIAPVIPKPEEPKPIYFGDEVVAYASNFLGTPYVWGGTSPSGFDCSGFTQYVFRHFGVIIGRTTYDQINDGTAVARDQLRPGDLVFFGTWSDPHHVGIYVGNNNYIHSPKTGDVVKISSLLLRSDYVTARRITK